MNACVTRRGFLRFAAAVCVQALPVWAQAGAGIGGQALGIPLPDVSGERAWRPYDPYEHLWRYVSAAESKDMNPLVKESGQS